MNPTLKKILQTALFVLCTLVAPSLLLLLFVDSSNNFGVYVIVYGFILFAILGYIIAFLITWLVSTAICIVVRTV